MENKRKRLSEKLSSDELQNWMCSLYIDFDYDVVEKTDLRETIEHFSTCIRIVAEINFPKSTGEYDSKSKKIDE